MADAITSVDTTESISEGLFLKPFTDDPAVTELGLDVKAVKGIRRLYFNSQLDKITYKKTSCGWTFSGGAEVTHKDMTPIELAVAIEQCYEPFMQTFLAEGLPAGSMRGELSTEIIDILTQLQADVFKRDVLTLLFLGDTASSDNYYKVIDGIFKKLNAAAALNLVADAGAITDTDIDLTHIEGTLYGIWQMQPRLLRAAPANAKKWWVTGTVYDAWARYLQTQTGNQTVLQTNYLTDGVNNVSYQGVQMVPIRLIDDRLNTDFLTGSPALPDDPHRIILTVPDNHALRMDKASFGDAQQWYEKKDDKFYAVGSCLLAYEYKYDEMQVIAGF